MYIYIYIYTYMYITICVLLQRDAGRPRCPLHGKCLKSMRLHPKVRVLFLEGLGLCHMKILQVWCHPGMVFQCSCEASC